MSNESDVFRTDPKVESLSVPYLARFESEEPLSVNARAAIRGAVATAILSRNPFAMGHHLLFQFISIHELTYSPILYDAVRIAGGDPNELAQVTYSTIKNGPTLAPGQRLRPLEEQPLYNILLRAAHNRVNSGYASMTQLCLLRALIEVDSGVGLLCKVARVNYRGLPRGISEATTNLGNMRIRDAQKSGFPLVRQTVRPLRISEGAMPPPPDPVMPNPKEILKQFAVDLTAKAEQNLIDPVVGRDNEIRRVIQVLCRRTKNNAVLIGEPGVGKTSIAEGLALRIAHGDVPQSLQGRLWSLDVGALRAGAGARGEFEKRIQDVLQAVSTSSENGPGIILFIDEMHVLLGSKPGGEGDAANLFKPLLARGKLRCIGATTLKEYSQFIEKDAALERRFSQIIIQEPSVTEAITILRGIKEKYEVHHAVRIKDGALVAAAELAHRYLTSRRLPDSAIDLVDECCANLTATRDTRPEAIDVLERRKLQLEVEIRALKKETEPQSVSLLKRAKKELENIKEQIRPMNESWESEKQTNVEINELKKQVEYLKNKAEEAERGNDLDEVAHIKYRLLPDSLSQLANLESRFSQEESSGRRMLFDAVTPESIAEVVARWTGVPTSRLLSTERQKLLKLEDVLAEQVVGQPEAVMAVADAVRLSRSGLGNASRPIASFLFAGPSGTGKTLLSKTLATSLFDSPDVMLRIDASEYSEKHSIAKLIGAPPGYKGHDEGGQLTDYVRRKPFCIILIDEVEKACKEFTTLFLQVLDDGRLTDSQGRVVDFKNTVIIMTSNLGSHHLIGMPDGPPSPKRKDKVIHSIESHFIPEFINRIDEIVIFRALSPNDMHKIVSIRLDELHDRVRAKKMALFVDDATKQYLAVKGYSAEYGARPLNRVIQKEVSQPMSRSILENQFEDGETIRVVMNPADGRPMVAANTRRGGTPAKRECLLNPRGSKLDDRIPSDWLGTILNSPAS